MTEPNIPITPGIPQPPADVPQPPNIPQPPQPYPPYGYPPQYAPAGPYGIQVEAHMGLHQGVHIANIILSVVSCGGWLPFYLLIALMMPPKRVRVVAPFGTPPHLIDEARRQAMQLTPAEQAIVKTRRQGLLVAGITVACLVAVFVLIALVSQT